MPAASRGPRDCRLDRLARNVAFIANLMNSAWSVAVDISQANRLTIHILAAGFTMGQVKLLNEDLLLEELPIIVDGPPGVFG
jgi:hypothetical protein